jgi:apolipoprotein N-acyltransferase
LTRSPRWPASAGLLLAAALGAAHSLAFTHLWAWPLQIVLIAVVAWRISTATVRIAAATGLVFGTAWVGAGTWWLFISLHTYGGLPGWLAVLAILLLSAFLSLYLAAGFAAFARWRRGAAGPDALLFGAAWLLAELARGVIFTGFPWLASGYAQVDSPLAVLAPWVGVYGIGLVLAVISAWIGLAFVGPWRQRALPVIAVALALAAAAGFGPGQWSKASGTLTVSLLQGNVAQDEKFATDHMPEALAWAAEQLLGARGELVVAPETVIPLLPSQLDPAYWKALTDHFSQGPQAALIGLPLGDEVVGYTNSAAGLSTTAAGMAGGFYRYDKHHLVPFGEFIPFGFRWFTQMMNIPLGDFNRGPVGAASFAVRGERIGANICYEDLFGEELAARFVDAPNAPTVFANISNIGWFGNTSAVAQHLEISRMRALEFQRPMLRATNTGATAVIDHDGRVTHSLAPFTRGVLEASVQGRTGLTPFARWAASFDLWPLWVLAAGIVAAAALAPRRLR